MTTGDPETAADSLTAADGRPGRENAWSEPPPDPYAWEPEAGASTEAEPPEPPPPDVPSPGTGAAGSLDSDARTEAVDEATARARAAAEEIHRRDRSLVSAALEGNLDAFNHLVELYQDMLY